MIEEIRRIFDAHGTNFRVVVSPNYDHVPLHPVDLEALRELFGGGNVRDFSGVNEITSDVRNYYERVHFRPHVGESILSELYGTRSE